MLWSKQRAAESHQQILKALASSLVAIEKARPTNAAEAVVTIPNLDLPKESALPKVNSDAGVAFIILMSVVLLVTLSWLTNPLLAQITTAATQDGVVTGQLLLQAAERIHAGSPELRGLTILLCSGAAIKTLTDRLKGSSDQG